MRGFIFVADTITSMVMKRRHLLQDLGIVALSIVISIIGFENGFVERILGSFGELEYLGVFVAGMFFTSMFTTAPAMLVLGVFAQTISPAVIVLLGAVGAVVGDYLIFLFVKDRISSDVSYLLSIAKRKRFPHIFSTKLFRSVAPLLGAVIIASPLPDEIGVAMLGLTKVKSKAFFLVSFVGNAVGILLIVWVARLLA